MLWPTRKRWAFLREVSRITVLRALTEQRSTAASADRTVCPLKWTGSMWCSSRPCASILLGRRPRPRASWDCVFPPKLLHQRLISLLLLQASTAPEIPLKIVVATCETRPQPNEDLACGGVREPLSAQRLFTTPMLLQLLGCGSPRARSRLLIRSSITKSPSLHPLPSPRILPSSVNGSSANVRPMSCQRHDACP